MIEFHTMRLFRPIKNDRKNAASLLLSLSIWSTLFFCTANARIVKVEDGFLRGDEAASKNGRKYYEFCGIPYAAPPVGDLRFKPPQSPSPWKGVRPSQRPPKCIQPGRSNTTVGQEDCLYMNIYTPQHIAAIFHDIPVVVYIHGGGFKFDTSTSYNPKYLMGSSNPVILVTFNHRLGPLGFLSMNDDTLPGNYALKDQLMVLKWVNRNIKAFGGNPKSVTLMGQSSGAVCVQLHLYSEKSKGLFHKAISQSGPLLSSYGFMYPNAAKVVASNLLLKTGCLQNDANKTSDCLRKIKAELIVQISTQIMTWDWFPEPVFRPTLEYYGDSKDRFLSVDPRKSQFSSKVPYLHGHLAADGVLFAIEFLKNNSTLMKVLNETYPRFLPVALDFKNTVNSAKNFEKIAADVVKAYFGNDSISSDKISRLVQIFTDAVFAYPTVKSILNQNVSQYVYVFNHQISSNSFQQKFLPEYKEKLGPAHGDELPYLFYYEATDKNMTQADQLLRETMISYWTNFATYGNPEGISKNKTWTMVRSNDIEYLRIELNSSTMQTGLANDRFRFWNSIFND